MGYLFNIVDHRAATPDGGPTSRAEIHKNLGVALFEEISKFGEWADPGDVIVMHSERYGYFSIWMTKQHHIKHTRHAIGGAP